LYQEKIYIIFNPTADHGKAVKRIALVEAEMDRAEVSYEMVLTQSSGHAVELARQGAIESVRARREGRAGYGVIAAAGGDGTVNEVLNGLMRAREDLKRPGGLQGHAYAESDGEVQGQSHLKKNPGTPESGVPPEHETLPEFGVLPVGRGNDFAYGAGIPKNLREACRMLVSSHGYTMDMGKITGGYYPEGRYFGNGIGIGFDTLVGLEAARMSWIPGFLGYVYGALKMLVVYPRGPLVQISPMGAEKHKKPEERIGLIETRSQQISVMNGRRMGGAFFMAPDSIINDGKLDLCMTHGQLSKKELLKALGQYTRGSQVNNPHVLTGRASGYRISALEGGLACHADGETICINDSELVVECVPGALRIRSLPRET
jgi:diacylglycerol kinase family enzyme